VRRERKEVAMKEVPREASAVLVYEKERTRMERGEGSENEVKRGGRRVVSHRHCVVGCVKEVR
jgi:hypothetical protein